jgi:putative transposase
MPWKETRLMKLREEFVLRALEPAANVSELCRDFGISRKTAYKWVARFRERGVAGLDDLSRRPHNSPLRVDAEMAIECVRLRRIHPHWGPKKLRAILLRSFGKERAPSVRTIARIVERAGEPPIRKRRPSTTTAPTQSPSVIATAPNDVWTADFKGWWRTGDSARAEPLTIRDAHSRFILAIQLMHKTDITSVKDTFERLFERHGLPACIQVDNGSPFISMRARGGLTALSAWWVALGIRLVRGRLGHPEDNGAHERMHADMRFELEDEACANLPAQQAACDRWRQEFNHVRPHEALEQRVPADIYRKSDRQYRGVRRPSYPAAFTLRKVDSSGGVKLNGVRFRVGEALRERTIGILPVSKDTFRIQYYELDLGQVVVPALSAD